MLDGSREDVTAVAESMRRSDSRSPGWVAADLRRRAAHLNELADIVDPPGEPRLAGGGPGGEMADPVRPSLRGLAHP